MASQGIKALWYLSECMKKFGRSAHIADRPLEIGRNIMSHILLWMLNNHFIITNFRVKFLCIQDTEHV